MFRRINVLLLVLFLTPTLLVSPASARQKSTDTAKAVVAVFQLDSPVTESPQDEMMAIFGSPGVSLKDLVERMRKAADDPNVKAVVVTLDGASIGLAQMEELRSAMKHVRDSGKDVYAHCDSMGMGGLALLSGANRVSIVPTGDLWITGLYGELPFLRGLLDKIGVQPDFMTCGAYKSAAEMFTNKQPSPEADAMQNWLLDSIDATLVKMVADGRGVNESKVRQWIDGAPYTADQAKKAGIVDAVEFRADFEQMLRTKYGEEFTFNRRYGREEKKQLDLSNPMAIFRIFAEMGRGQKKADKPAVAVVYVEGAIIAGKADDSPFAGQMAASSNIRKALDEAARDENIKAVVLRVDSPGGSATGSEIILDATRRVREHKPLVVSMGNVAGSGGYYVACGTDTIFAERSTITGSIGVVGGKMVTTDMWDKVGIGFTPYKRGANADIMSTSTLFSPTQREHMQGWMDEIYAVFKDHVVKIRGEKLKKPIDELAGGRVYTGQQALELGLVDKLGGLNDAIAFVAAEAGIEKYDVRVIPEPKNLLERIFEEAGGKKDDGRFLAIGAGAGVSAKGGSILELALPHLQGLDPQRVRLIARALRQLQTIQQEGVSLMMPEMLIGQ